MSTSAAYTIPLDSEALAAPAGASREPEATRQTPSEPVHLTVARHAERFGGAGLTPAGVGGVGIAAGLGARIAGLAPPEEYDHLLERRQELAQRKLLAALTAEETREFRLVSWHLDRIESSKYQDSMEAWKVAATGYSKLAEEISGLVAALSSPPSGGRRPR